MLNGNGLVTSVDQLAELVGPITRGDVGVAAIDTETTEVKDDRFTPYGTDTRICGFSISFGEDVDFYVPLRHVPYDWRRREDLILAKDPEWHRLLVEAEGIIPGQAAWEDGMDPNLPLGPCLEILQACFRTRCRWVAHNWGFDGPMLSVEGLTIPWDRIEETQFLSQLTDHRPLDAWDVPNNRFVVRHNLKGIGEDFLGIPPSQEARLKEAKRALGKGGALLQNYAMLPLRSIVSPYACQDTRLTLGVFHHCLGRDTWKDEKIQARYLREVRLIPCIQGMMAEGVEIRVDLARELAQKAETELAMIAADADKAAGRTLNFGHSETLAQQLYQEMGVPQYRDKSDTQAATLKMVLKKCPEELKPAVQGVLEYRAKEKELTAFFRPLADYGADGTIHTIIRQMAAATTRMSAAKPNLQQAKKKGEVRRVFKPGTGKVFVFCDYDQVEMRIGAHYTHAMPESFRSVFTWSCTMAKRGSCKGRPPHGDREDAEGCRKVIHSGRYPDWKYRPPQLHLFKGFMEDPDFDPHQRMADIAGVDRDTAKTSNFALLYGAGYAKLAETLDCTGKQAKDLFHFFWDEAYPELGYVREFIAERLRRAGTPTKFSHKDYISTLKGGRIYLDSAYKGLNYLIQRSAREVFGDGLLEVCEYVATLDGYRAVMPVHDEVILEVAEDAFDKDVLRHVTGLMTGQAGGCTVPLTVGCEVSHGSWHKDDRDEVEL